ncbi:MAG: Mu-like prophage major head subunit gpT family protein, partial [Deltaproteobacteria bacterium]|nr:Mu-like prophage major head subunit gpT family protein [Deltaproteobacteria bacterium]
IDAELKNDSFTNLCFDGQYFYDTDHVVAGSSVSNKGTAALSAATKTLVTASYGAARLAIMNFKDDEGRPLALIPNILEVPPALEATAKLICNNKKLEDDKPNPYVGTAEVVVNPRLTSSTLTSSTAWFLHVTNRPLKPFIYQERKAPVFVQQANPDTEDVFMRKKFKFGAEARAAGGYGLWQLSYGSTGAA